MQLGTFIFTDTLIAEWDPRAATMKFVVEAIDEFGRPGTVAFALSAPVAKNFARQFMLATAAGIRRKKESESTSD